MLTAEFFPQLLLLMVTLNDSTWYNLTTNFHPKYQRKNPYHLQLTKNYGYLHEAIIFAALPLNQIEVLDLGNKTELNEAGMVTIMSTIVYFPNLLSVYSHALPKEIYYELFSGLLKLYLVRPKMIQETCDFLCQYLRHDRLVN